ncbi:MAG TPA: class I SAM-dependent methyltransferase, partial [Candidatus Binatia bacterium]|nr:class I SAM-dependent methyltransferase [Candidatus Binatia bacterium]
MANAGTARAARGEPGGYELLDAGDGRRLERFGRRVVDRPAPAALEARRDFHAWRASDLRFDPGRGWTAAGKPVEPAGDEPWVLVVDGLRLELRPTDSGGLGLYPEHAANLAWVADRVRERVAARSATGEARDAGSVDPPAVLHLFAHTGLLTLAAARAGAAVAHVDAARGAVEWARRNAALSGLEDRPVRWLVDDAAAFVAREARRGRRYDGIVLDPPSFGR